MEVGKREKAQANSGNVLSECKKKFFIIKTIIHTIRSLRELVKSFFQELFQNWLDTA